MKKHKNTSKPSPTFTIKKLNLSTKMHSKRLTPLSPTKVLRTVPCKDLTKIKKELVSNMIEAEALIEVLGKKK